MTEKSRENRARRRLGKMGYALQKCRNRTDIYHYGLYRIIDAMYNTVVTGNGNFDFSLDDVEKFIENEREDN